VADLPARIDDYVRTAALHRPTTLRDDIAFFDAFYFSCNPDPSRFARLHALLS